MKMFAIALWAAIFLVPAMAESATLNGYFYTADRNSTKLYDRPTPIGGRSVLRFYSDFCLRKYLDPQMHDCYIKRLFAETPSVQWSISSRMDRKGRIFYDLAFTPILDPYPESDEVDYTIHIFYEYSYNFVYSGGNDVDGYYSFDARVGAPVPVPAAFGSLALALGGLAVVWSRKGRRSIG